MSVIILSSLTSVIYHPFGANKVFTYFTLFFSEGSDSRLSLYYPIVGRIETHDEARALWRTFVNHLCDPRTRQ